MQNDHKDTSTSEAAAKATGWYGIDLDGTLAEYTQWVAPDHIGRPIPGMVNRVKGWLANGETVKIFTARMWPLGTDRCKEAKLRERVRDACLARNAIQTWCLDVFGQELPITCIKDLSMIELWDDRAVRVIPNAGRKCCGDTTGIGSDLDCLGIADVWGVSGSEVSGKE